jgi:hypothetical protein
MLYLTITLFALSAIFGLLILIKWLTKKEASRTVIYSHGIVAAVALVLLIVYSASNPNDFPLASLILFGVAALAGFYMFFNDLAQKPSPIALAIIHALVAVFGVVTLLYFVIN